MCCLFVYSHSRSAWNKFIIYEKKKGICTKQHSNKTWQRTISSLCVLRFTRLKYQILKDIFCTLKWKTFFSLRRLKTKFTFHITIYIYYHISFFDKLCRKLCKFSSNTGDAAHVESRQFKTKQPNRTKNPNVTSIYSDTESE